MTSNLIGHNDGLNATFGFGGGFNIENYLSGILNDPGKSGDENEVDNSVLVHGAPVVAGSSPVAVALADPWDSTVRDHLPSIVENKREVSRALAYGIDVSGSISQSDVQDQSGDSATAIIADCINSPERSKKNDQPEYANIPLLTPAAILSGNFE